MNPLHYFLMVGAAVVLGVTWAVVCMYLDARLGGWHCLAEHYRHPQIRHPQFARWFLEKIVLGGGSSAAIVVVTADPDGMSLCNAFPWLLFHPELFNPWAEMKAVRERHWYGDRVHLTFAAVPDVPITIRGRLANEIQHCIGRKWPEANQAAKRQPAGKASVVKG